MNHPIYLLVAMREPITCPDCGPYHAVEAQVQFDDIMRVECGHCGQRFEFLACSQCEGRGAIEGIGNREIECDQCKQCGGHLIKIEAYGRSVLSRGPYRSWRRTDGPGRIS